MTDYEKKKIIDDLFSLDYIKYPEEELTGGYCQIQPSGKHQAVLLFGYTDSKNPKSSKVPLSDEDEAILVYKAIAYFVSMKDIKSRPRLGTFKVQEEEDIKDVSPIVIKEEHPKGGFFNP